MEKNQTREIFRFETISHSNRIFLRLFSRQKFAPEIFNLTVKKSPLSKYEKEHVAETPIFFHQTHSLDIYQWKQSL